MSFSQPFLKVIYNCISFASFSVLVKGTPTPLFKFQEPKSYKTRGPPYIIKMLEGLSSFTGLEVNKTKSSVTFSKICEGNIDLQNTLGFQVKQFPKMYLGTLIFGKKKTYNQWWKLIQPIDRLRAKWSEKCLSYTHIGGGSNWWIHWIGLLQVNTLIGLKVPPFQVP